MPVDAEILWGDTPTMLGDTLTFTDGEIGGLDEGSVEYYTSFPNYKADLATIGIQKNERWQEISGFYFFVKSIRPKPEGSARAIVTLDLIGLAQATWEDRRKREISAYGQVVNVGPIEKIIIVTDRREEAKDKDGNTTTARRRIPKLDSLGEIEYKTITTPSGAAERWNVNDPSLRIVETYFTISQPNTADIGKNVPVASPPIIPIDPWASYQEAMRFHHPNGWVLDDRQISIIIPGKLWGVRDTISYYRTAIPD